MLLVKKYSLITKQVTKPIKVLMQTIGTGNNHVHIHIIPVFSMYDMISKDILDKMESKERKASDEELNLIAEKYRSLKE